jgi:hypothetical protein
VIAELSWHGVLRRVVDSSAAAKFRRRQSEAAQLTDIRDQYTTIKELPRSNLDRSSATHPMSLVAVLLEDTSCVTDATHVLA